MGWVRQSWAIMGFMGLIACEPLPTPQTPPSDTRPQIREPEITVAPPSDESKELATYYRRLQNDLLVQGLLRGDGGGPDTPFTDTILARNFVRIALFDEYVTDGDFLRPQATLSKLRRWDQPIRMDVTFGDSVPLEQRAKDASTEGDRKAYGPRLRELVPGIATSSLNAIVNLPRDQLCIVVAFSEGGASTYSKAIAVIRGEPTDNTRRTPSQNPL